MNPPPATASTGSSPQTPGLAIASLILGICGIILCLGPLAGIPAVICGHLAQSRIKRSGGALKGEGLVMGGLITGYISIAMIVLIGLLAAIAIPNFVKARNQAQLNGCMANLRTIQSVKEAWALENRKPPETIPTDDDLFGAGKLIDRKKDCPAGGAYSLNSVREEPSCAIHGTPSSPSN